MCTVTAISEAGAEDMNRNKNIMDFVTSSPKPVEEYVAWRERLSAACEELPPLNDPYDLPQTISNRIISMIPDKYVDWNILDSNLLGLKNYYKEFLPLNNLCSSKLGTLSRHADVETVFNIAIRYAQSVRVPHGISAEQLCRAISDAGIYNHNYPINLSSFDDRRRYVYGFNNLPPRLAYMFSELERYDIETVVRFRFMILAVGAYHDDLYDLDPDDAPFLGPKFRQADRIARQCLKENEEIYGP